MEWSGGGGVEWWRWRGVCILNPTNPAVLNLCLPVPEEEATGRTHSAPLRPNFVGSDGGTIPAPGRELSLLYLWETQDDRFSPWGRSFCSELILFSREGF